MIFSLRLKIPRHISVNFLRRVGAISSLLFTTWSVAFGADVGAGVRAGFDVNDVSILFPPTEKLGSYPEIFLDSTDGLGCLSSKLFDEIGEKVHKVSQNPEHFPLSIWHVVALRYDPCFAKSAAEPQSCVQQVRLVAQPLRGNGFADVAMHLLYTVGEGLPQKNDPVLADLNLIKELSQESTRGQPLQAHPGLAKEQQTISDSHLGPLAEKIFDFIDKYCTESQLKELTFTDANTGLNGPWFFMGGKVEAGHWKPENIPGLEKPAKMQFTTDIGVAKPMPDKNIGIHDFLSIDNYSKPLTEAQIESLQKVENPRLTNTRNTDCASCHLVGNDLMSFDPDGLATKSFFRSPLGITGYSLKQNHPLVSIGQSFGEGVRVFGYFLTTPIVAPITANSSALVAEEINHILQLEPPSSRDCRGQDAPLRLCLLKGEDQCFEKYCH